MVVRKYATGCSGLGLKLWGRALKARRMIGGCVRRAEDAFAGLLNGAVETYRRIDSEIGEITDGDRLATEGSEPIGTSERSVGSAV